MEQWMIETRLVTAIWKEALRRNAFKHITFQFEG